MPNQVRFMDSAHCFEGNEGWDVLVAVSEATTTE